MAMLGVLASLLFPCVGFWIGLRAAKLRGKLGLAVGIGALALIGLRAAVADIPGAESALYDFEYYPYFKTSWAAGVVGIVLGFLGKKAPQRSLRVLLWVLCGAVAAQETHYCLQFVLAERWYGALTGKVDATGYCAQTSDYTCGAAAAAMLLHSVGVETGEQEMARLCLVRAGIGVTDLTLRRGIRRKLQGAPYTIQVLRGISYDELLRLRKPCLVSIRESWLLDHTIIVERMSRRFVGIADPEPKVRRALYRPPAFQRVWRGDAMVLSREGDPEPRPRPQPGPKGPDPHRTSPLHAAGSGLVRALR